MNTTAPVEVPVRTRHNYKLNASRYPRMSALMAAIVGHLLDIPIGNPPIAVTSDGFVLARADGEAGVNLFIGNYGDLIRNWDGLLAVAGLTRIERVEAEFLFAAKIGYLGRTTAFHLPRFGSHGIFETPSHVPDVRRTGSCPFVLVNGWRFHAEYSHFGEIKNEFIGFGCSSPSTLDEAGLD